MIQEVEFGEYFYDKCDVLFTGSSQVFGCRHKNKPNDKLCVKIKKWNEDPKSQREMLIMKDLITLNNGNPNIVKVEHVGIYNNKIFIVLERCDGNLQQLLSKRKKEEGQTFYPYEALEIIKQIIHGYKVLFAHDIIHRDIKPENILYKGHMYKIADFSLARVIDNQQDLTKIGTPKYSAPQLFHEPTFTNSADIYSIGIMFYELIYGTLPYRVDSKQDVRRATRVIKTNPIKLDLNKQGLTMEISDLIESMLMYSERERVYWTTLFIHPLLNDTELVVDSVDCPQDSDNNDDNSLIEILQQISPDNAQLNEDDQLLILDNNQDTFLTEAEYQYQQIDKNPIQAINKIKTQCNSSDKFYNIAIFHQCIYFLFSKCKYFIFLNQRISQSFIYNKIIEIKIQLYYLICYYFQTSHKFRQENVGGSTFNQIDDYQQTSLKLLRQQLEQEIYNLNLQYRIEQIIPKAQKYYQERFLQIYKNIRQFLIDQSNQDDVEYISLLFIMERMYEQSSYIQNSINLCFFIQEIQQNACEFEKIKNYLETRRNN